MDAKYKFWDAKYNFWYGFAKQKFGNLRSQGWQKRAFAKTDNLYMLHFILYHTNVFLFLAEKVKSKPKIKINLNYMPTTPTFHCCQSVLVLSIGVVNRLLQTTLI